MKIYTDKEEYEKALVYWSNCCGDLHHNGEWIEEKDLPPVLQEVYDRLWEEGNGSYSYLAEYNGKPGIALVNEYHEYTEEGARGEIYNYQMAVRNGKRLEAQDYPVEVFIGREMGFPGITPFGIEGEDNATELVAFMAADIATEDYRKVADWLLNNAYKVA